MKKQTKQVIGEFIFVFLLTLILTISLFVVGIGGVIIITSVVMIYLLAKIKYKIRKLYKQMKNEM